MAFALAAILATVVARWRVLRRGARVGQAACLLAHVLAGGLLGALTLRHDALLSAVLPVDIGEAARFALTPFEPVRLAATSGLVFLHAAAALVLVSLIRAATTVTCRDRGHPRRPGCSRPPWAP